MCVGEIAKVGFRDCASLCVMSLLDVGRAEGQVGLSSSGLHHCLCEVAGLVDQAAALVV